MEEPTAEPQKTSTNDKGCQTEEICNSSPETTGPTSGSAHPPGYCMEPGDPALLQKQIQTSKSGIQQIIECFRSGTTQLRHILLKEVDTIFECKLCRSLFRGLPNLITHKEFYCFPRHHEPDGSSSRDARQSAAMKELIEAIYPRKDDYVVRLEPISSNQNAVFQHVAREDRAASQAWVEHRKEKDKEKEREKEKDPEESQEETAGSDIMESQVEKQEETEEEEEEEEEEAEEDEGEEEEEEMQGTEDEEDGDECTEDETDQQDSPEKGSDVDLDMSDSSGPVVQGVTITCCMCGKDFNSRQSIRRHCRKMHRNRLEELRKFTEMRTVPISLLSMVKVPSGVSPVKAPYGKSCPVCYKTFATKANVRRHFDEVHRGLRRDLITPDIATKPGEPLSLESKPSPAPAAPQYNLASGKCLICKRNYSTQARLRRHLRIVHKIRPKLAASTSSNATPTQAPSSSTGKKAVKRSASPPPPEVQRRGRPKKYRREEANKPRKQEDVSDEGDGSSTLRRPKLALGFDFKLLYCKLCKRQFSSRQNLDKHIELHTDNDNEIFIKFYRCPLCSYETRRKRDVLRHITVVHKKPGTYLTKIMATIESRAVKKPAELVLKNSGTNAKRTQPPAAPQHPKEEMNGRHEPAVATTPHSARKHADTPAATATTPSTPVTRRHELPPPTPPVTRKHSLFHSSPPVTRKSDHHHQHHLTSTPHTRKQETPQSLKQEPSDSQHSSSSSSGSSSTEVRVTKNFSLHACDMCGRAFAKKLYLETHKRSHRNAAAAAASSDDHRTQGVSTRSKALL